MEVEAHPAGFGQGNVGYSGTPMWKIMLQREQQKEMREKQVGPVAGPSKEQEEAKEAVPLQVLADGVCLGGQHLGGGKPVVRHVLVKDLRKVSRHVKLNLPAEGVFSQHAPMGLFALFDGQSAMGEAGPVAAEYCARHFHEKLLKSLSALPPDRVNDTFIKASFLKTFEDLDSDLLAKGLAPDGCGAAVALIIGAPHNKLFTAVLGRCDAVLAECKDLKKDTVPDPISLGARQGRAEVNEEQIYIRNHGGQVIKQQGKTFIKSPDGSISHVTRALGDAAWKQWMSSDGPLLRCSPEVHSIDLSWGQRHPFIMLVGAAVSDAMIPQESLGIASEFPLRPKAACGEIAANSVQRTTVEDGTSNQCTACVISLTPPDKKAMIETPAAKKQKTGEIESVRLRHVLVKHKDVKNPVDRKNKPVTRTKQEAESILRRILRELRESGEDSVEPSKAAKVTPKFTELCRENSDCPTSQKGGAMCGDLGWLNTSQLHDMSKEFEDTARALKLATWSDITPSVHGLHILLRIY